MSLRMKCLSYELEIERGLLHNREKFSTFGNHFVVITDERVRGLYAEKLATLLGAELFSFPSGEHHKTRETKQMIEDQMLEKGIGKDFCLIGIGGGVVTDLGGFIAATYGRGLPFLSIPTTLLGMVDASMGGKTGVNVPQGKNLIGAFYRPEKIFIDPNVLDSLPEKEIRNGYVEMIKHGAVADLAYFEALEQKIPLEEAILGSCKIKTEIVEADEKEGGKRHLLNFGHTVGHALETLSNYTLSHGEAVALGMVIESSLALHLGYLKQSSFDRMLALLKTYHIPLQIPSGIEPADLLEAMKMDKKSRNREPRFVMMQEIGSPLDFGGAYCIKIDISTLQLLLREVIKLIPN